MRSYSACGGVQRVSVARADPRCTVARVPCLLSRGPPCQRFGRIYCYGQALFSLRRMGGSMGGAADISIEMGGGALTISKEPLRFRSNCVNRACRVSSVNTAPCARISVFSAESSGF